jgi:hypothetical protein
LKTADELLKEVNEKEKEIKAGKLDEVFEEQYLHKNHNTLRIKIHHEHY